MLNVDLLKLNYICYCVRHMFKNAPVLVVIVCFHYYLAQLRRSSRERKSAISSDYVVYLEEVDYDIGIHEDPYSFHKP